MAYRRTTRRSTARRSTSYARSGRRAPARRSTTRARSRTASRRSAPRQQAIKLVIETRPASAVARPDLQGMALVEKPSKKAKL